MHRSDISVQWLFMFTRLCPVSTAVQLAGTSAQRNRRMFVFVVVPFVDDSFFGRKAVIQPAYVIREESLLPDPTDLQKKKKGPEAVLVVCKACAENCFVPGRVRSRLQGVCLASPRWGYRVLKVRTASTLGPPEACAHLGLSREESGSLQRAAIPADAHHSIMRSHVCVVSSMRRFVCGASGLRRLHGLGTETDFCDTQWKLSLRI